MKGPLSEDLLDSERAVTAICGNDITSSFLYGAALAAIIGSPSGRFPYRVSELGGARLII